MRKEEFLREVERLDRIKLKICNEYANCTGCILEDCCNSNGDNSEEYSLLWNYAEEHPIKTRQSEFLKLFPNTRLEYDTINICPNDIENSRVCPCNDCKKCKEEYWLKEIE